MHNRNVKPRDEPKNKNAKHWPDLSVAMEDIMLKEKGIAVCKRRNGRHSSLYPYYRGYVEGHFKRRIQVRVNELIVREGWADANFKPQIIWEDVSQWEICE